jgi:hypothetical protein
MFLCHNNSVCIRFFLTCVCMTSTHVFVRMWRVSVRIAIHVRMGLSDVCMCVWQRQNKCWGEVGKCFHPFDRDVGGDSELQKSLLFYLKFCLLKLFPLSLENSSRWPVQNCDKQIVKLERWFDNLAINSCYIGENNQISSADFCKYFEFETM